MDAGLEQAIKRPIEIFGLSEAACVALKTCMHRLYEDGATFLAQFSMENGINTRLLTSTLGPVGLRAFSTTAEDEQIRNKLYQKLNPAEAHRVLTNLFPNGSVK